MSAPTERVKVAESILVACGALCEASLAREADALAKGDLLGAAFWADDAARQASFALFASRCIAIEGRA